MHIAHIRKDGKKQSLDKHLLATAEWCALFAQKAELCQTGRLAGYLHDMGKVGPLFQSYIRYSHEHPEDTHLRGTVPHSTQGAKFIYENYTAHDAAANLTASILALVIASHHGGLMDCLSPDGTQPLYERLARGDPKLCYEDVLKQFPAECPAYSELGALFEAATEEVKAFAQRCRARELSGPFSLHLMVRLLFSCLIDADRYDSYRFEAGLPGQVCLPAPPPWDELSARLEAHLANFDASKPIHALRGEISRGCKDAARNPCGIYRLSVPTGGGKTLASLRFALEHAKLYGKDRIFYIIPFTTIIDQNAKDIRSILQRDDLILEHHSNVIPDEQRRTGGNEEEDEYKLLTERWSSPIILTTMVQFLNSLYSGGTRAARRMHHLTNAVLIFDEIQAVPLNCIHLLNAALNFLTRLCGTTVVLCTATQPSLSTVQRPLLNEGAELVGNLDEMFRSFRRTRIVDARVDGGYTISDLCHFTLAKMEGLRTGLIVFNTKGGARNFYREICRHNGELPQSEKYFVYYLSTDLCPAHRKKVLDEIRRQLETGRVICVSTQLIEAGVDLSFQCVIRALAGLDSIAQAAGRCNRHAEHACRDVYVVNIAGENLKGLPSIKNAQEAAQRILNELRADPSAYGGDLLSPEAMQQYYHYYYHQTQNELLMDYPVRDVSPNATLYDLLGSNCMGRKELERHETAKPPLTQAFNTAGEHFHVIEDNTTAVIVPYLEEGKALIERLGNEDLSIRERMGGLRLAQQYSVNVFSHTMNQLEHERAVELLPGGVYALDERFYDDQMGVTTKGRPLPTLTV